MIRTFLALLGGSTVLHIGYGDCQDLSNASRSNNHLKNPRGSLLRFFCCSTRIVIRYFSAD